MTSNYQNQNDSDRPLSEATTFPAFLDTDPFPSTGPDGRPTSSSSAVTASTGDELDGSHGAPGSGGGQGTSSAVQGTTGPTGEPGLPPSRPTSVEASAVSSHPRSSLGARGSGIGAPPSSRRGLARVLENQHQKNGVAESSGAGEDGMNDLKSSQNNANANAGASRPTSAMSRTHVPSVAAGAGFLRPMSSQKLQAQRGQQTGSGTGGRPVSSLAQNVESVDEGEAGPKPRRRESGESEEKRRNRYSNASVHTLREGGNGAGYGHQKLGEADDIPPVPDSRGTIFTDRDGTNTFQSESAQGAAIAGSVASGTSTAPLHQSRPNNNPLPRLDTNNNTAVPPPKSPGNRSLRASFGLGSSKQRTNSHSPHNLRPTPSQHHQQLHSNPSSPTPNEKPSAIHQPSPKSRPTKGPGRNKDYYAGNTLFLFGGRLLNTKAKPLNTLTFLLTALPCGLFFGFSAPWLWHHVSPALPIVFAYVCAVCLSSFGHAAFSDPGILPRNLHPHPPNEEEERDPLTVGPPTTEWVMVKTFPASPAASSSPNSGKGDGGSRWRGRGRKSTDPEHNPTTTSHAGEDDLATTATAMEVPTKYCKTCTIWRPPRAHHCRICDACLETQDHHCVWLNNCVGRRNYRFFFAYVASATLLSLLLLAFSTTHVAVYGAQNSLSFREALSGRVQERMAFAMLIYSLLALPYPASLFAYHVFLLARGETTREYLNSHKFLPRDRHRPFTLGGKWSRNWIAGLCRPRGLGYLDFGKKWETGDGRFGFWVGKKERKARNKGAFSLGGKELGDAGGERVLEGDVEKFGNGYGNGANGGTGGSHAGGVEMRKLSPSASAQRSERRRRRKSSPTNNNNPGSTTPAGSASRSGSNAPSSTGGGGGLAHLQQASRSSAGLSLGGSGRGSLGAGGLNSTPR
ncbi:zf-DHHC-domain-containing protein [Hortaea werneckii]|nr:zf-DHHC-domain-containing protein [Hortaea werneckii]